MPRRPRLDPVSDGYAAVETATFWREEGDWEAERKALWKARRCFKAAGHESAAQLLRDVNERLKQRERMMKRE